MSQNCGALSERSGMEKGRSAKSGLDLALVSCRGGLLVNLFSGRDDMFLFPRCNVLNQ